MKNKELDNFILQVTQSIFRHSTHKDLQILLNEVNELYDGIQHVRNVEDIFIGPLYSQPLYGFPVGSSFFAMAEAVNNNKEKIYENPLYVGDDISESFRDITHRDSIPLLLCLGVLLGPKVFAHKGLLYRLRCIIKTNILQTSNYHDSIFGAKVLDTIEHTTPMFRRVFEFLNLAPSTGYRSYHQMYAMAEIFIKVYEGIGLPTKIPLDFVSYPAIRKAYLRHIMHHPEDIQYLAAFNHIRVGCSQSVTRALHYFAHTVGGVYTPIKGVLSTPLAKWYDKEINEKQLDGIFDEVIKEERRTFEELVRFGIGISLEANLKLTKKRFAKIEKLVESPDITEYRELAGPFLIKDSSMLSIKILRRQIND